ncbi:MAG: hypothetical protein EAZ35_09445 [Sphingobacteriia bacterium]|nr:MAG: hypothetical protein EAZ35_09445 [Sphingobacteriia bacterium]
MDYFYKYSFYLIGGTNLGYFFSLVNIPSPFCGIQFCFTTLAYSHFDTHFYPSLLIGALKLKPSSIRVG